MKGSNVVNFMDYYAKKHNRKMSIQPNQLLWSPFSIIKLLNSDLPTEKDTWRAK